MGGNEGETPETVAWGKWPGDHPLPIQLHFMLSADARPSAGSAVDHIGFSFADLDAKMQALGAAGVKIVGPVEEVPGLWKQAVVEDPWGTKLVLVQDPDALAKVSRGLGEPMSGLDIKELGEEGLLQTRGW